MNDEWIEEKERDALFEELHQMPHFDSVSETWVLVTPNGKEEGDAIYYESCGANTSVENLHGLYEGRTGAGDGSGRIL